MNISLVIIVIPLIIWLFLGQLYKPDKWYESIKKPSIIPHGYIFSIAWTIFYLSIGYAYYLALKDKPLQFWIIPILHLFVNFIYTPLLFGYHNLYASAVVVSLTLILALHQPKRKMRQYYLFLYILKLCFR